MNLEPIILSDNRRIQEIGQLRVDVWNGSSRNEIVNRKMFPDGWIDELDEVALHWFITDFENKIIAAARLNIFDNSESCPYYPFIRHLNIPDHFPFAILGRLVVHPEYRGLGLSRSLISERISFCEENNIGWATAFVNDKHVINIMESFDFNKAGDAWVNYHESTKPHKVNVFVREFSRKGMVQNHKSRASEKSLEGELQEAI